MDVDDLRKKSDDDLRIIAGMLEIEAAAEQDRESLIRLISSGTQENEKKTEPAAEKKQSRTKKKEESPEGDGAGAADPEAGVQEKTKPKSGSRSRQKTAAPAGGGEEKKEETQASSLEEAGEDAGKPKTVGTGERRKAGEKTSPKGSRAAAEKSGEAEPEEKTENPAEASLKQEPVKAEKAADAGENGENSAATEKDTEKPGRGKSAAGKNGAGKNAAEKIAAEKTGTAKAGAAKTGAAKASAAKASAAKASAAKTGAGAASAEKAAAEKRGSGRSAAEKKKPEEKPSGGAQKEKSSGKNAETGSRMASSDATEPAEGSVKEKNAEKAARKGKTKADPERIPEKGRPAAEPDSSLNTAEDLAEETAEKTGENGETEEKSAPGGKKAAEPHGSEVEGILEIMGDGYGFLRVDNFYSGPRDVYVSPVQIKRFGLRTGDLIKGLAKPQKDHSAYQALFYINEVNGRPVDKLTRRVSFEQLIPTYPDEKLVLEKNPKDLSTRLIDMVAPIGKGQRGMIVSPPKAGKTELMKKIANSISANYPEVVLIVLLIDERPEEVTDMRESVKGTVVSSTFDELPERHIKVSELVLERAQRLVEQGQDVVILMDSLTRLARAYNLTIPPTGRSLSGGLDPGALHKPKKFFGAARNIRGGGSLTIVATALVDTGSRLDDVIFEEFKGTGNMELHLDRKLSEKRIFPAIDISRSGTRKEELLLSESELNAIYALRKAIANVGAADATEMIIDKLAASRDNASFIASLKLDDR